MLRRLNNLKGIANELATKSDQINGLTAKQKDKLSQLQLINPEWNVIDDLTKLLYPFYECTKMLSGSKYCTLSNAFVAKKMLISFIQTQDETDSVFLNSLKKQLIPIALYHLEDKLEIRQKDITQMAAYSDPSTNGYLDEQEAEMAEKK